MLKGDLLTHHIVETDISSFLERAKDEAHRYGDDPWVFLRELAQNSRDAGSTQIEFEVTADETEETIICRDNGAGMSPADIQDFLLRLYASNKESDQDSIGYFGVGFWSVLLFSPRIIRIQTIYDNTHTAFEIDIPALSIRSIESDPNRIGTEIIIIRENNANETEEDIHSIVLDKLVYYAAHITPRNASNTIEVLLNGTPINRRFSLPPYGGIRFTKKHFQGVIGFSDRPQIRIYKGGLLVKDVASLREIIPSRKPQIDENSLGWHPHIAINIDDIRLLMDRNTMFEDRLLYDMVGFCEKILLRLHRKQIVHLLPMNMANLALFLRSRYSGTQKYAVRLIAGIIAISTVAFLSFYRFSGNNETLDSGFGIPAMNEPVYNPTDLNFDNWNDIPTTRSPNTKEWHLYYSTHDRFLFRLRTLATFTPSRGFTPEPHEESGTYPFYSIDENKNTITIETKISGSQSAVALPIPEHHVLHGPVIDSSGNPIPVTINQYDRPIVRVPQESILRYTSAPVHHEERRFTNYNKSANPDLPTDFRNACAYAQTLGVHDTVRYLTEFISNRYAYSADTPDCSANNRGWLNCILSSDSGDCDTLNGLLVYLLRYSGISSDLCVGIVGSSGRAFPGLHAWATYYAEKSWHIVDVTSRYDVSSESGPPSADDERENLLQTRSESPHGQDSGLAGNVPRTVQRLPSLLVPFTPLLLLPAILWIIHRLRRKPVINDDDMEQIAGLFTRMYQRGLEKDPIGLRFRPAFRTLAGSLLSLEQLENKSHRSVLLGLHPKSSITSQIDMKRMVILDRSHRLNWILSSHIPPVVWLDGIENVLQSAEIHPNVVRLEHALRPFNDCLRIRTLSGSPEYQEFSLRWKNSESTFQYIIIGEDHFMYDRIVHASMERSYAWFHVIESFLNTTTLFIRNRETILISLASTMEIHSELRS